RDVLVAVVDLAVDQAGRRLLAPQEREGQLGGGLRLGLDRLVDGHVLLAREDALDARELRVLAGGRLGRRRDAGALHRRDRAAGGAVVGGVDAHEAGLADRGDRLVHLGLRLVRAPVGVSYSLATLKPLLLMALCAP